MRPKGPTKNDGKICILDDVVEPPNIYPFWAFMIRFWPLLPPDYPFLFSSEPLQTFWLGLPLRFGVSCDDKLLRAKIMSIPSSTCPCSLLHAPARAKQGVGAWEGLRRVLPEIGFGSCSVNMSFPLSEELPASLICCGPVCPVGITATVHNVYF